MNQRVNNFDNNNTATFFQLEREVIKRASSLNQNNFKSVEHLSSINSLNTKSRVDPSQKKENNLASVL